MIDPRCSLRHLARVAALAGFLAAGVTHADDYADASQLVRSGQYQQALTRVDAALAAKPSDPQMRFLKGVIQRNLGKTSEALAIFTKLTEDYPELPEPYNNLAVLYAAQGQFDKARAALEMAIRTNPSYATAHENLGDVYARLASQAYNKALQLDHNNVAVPPKLALIRDVFKPNLSNPKPGSSTTPTTPTQAASVNPPAVASVPAPGNATPTVTPPVATAKPAPSTPAPGGAAAPSAPSKPAPSAPTGASANPASIEAAVRAWAQAWSDKQVDAYLAHYSPDFDPAGNQSLEAWKQDRRARILGKSRISVGISDLRVTMQGDKASAQFRQSYKADRLAVSSRKTLQFERRGEAWLITRESTGN